MKFHYLFGKPLSSTRKQGQIYNYGWTCTHVVSLNKIGL